MAELSNIDNLYQQAIAAHQQGRWQEAAQSYQVLLQQEPEHADALHLLGVICLQQNNLPDAKALISKAIKLDPTQAIFYNNLALVYGAEQDYVQAIAMGVKATQLDANFIDAWFNLGSFCQDNGDINAAEKYYRRCLQVAPNHARALNNLGNLLEQQGQSKAALPLLQQLVQQHPNEVMAQYNVANVYKTLAQFHDAERHFQQAIALKPDFALAHYNLGLLGLLQGKYAQGWAGYEWRFYANKLEQELDWPYPRWQGEDLQDKHILIIAEQGLGDSIQFARYLPWIAERAKQVTFLAQEPLAELFKVFDGIKVMSDKQEIAASVDYFSLLMSLPFYAETTLHNIPLSESYLNANKDKVNQWQSKIHSEKKKVGLVWAGNPQHGNDHNRSLPFAKLEPLLNNDKLQFYSLQKEHQSHSKFKEFKMVDLAPDLKSFSDTAAALKCLDCLVSVDTAPAHLAGALGVPCYLLLPFMPDWRWQMQGDTTPWYQSLSLLRQQQRGDWDSVLDKLSYLLA